MNKPKKPAVRIVRGKAPTNTKPPQPVDRTQPDSKVSRICELEFGESYSEAIRVELCDASKETINDARLRLRNNLTRAVTTAKTRSGNEYRLEVGDFLTGQTNAICVAAVITRTDEL